MDERAPAAWLGGYLGSGLADVTSDLGALDSSGRWAVVVTFEGEATCARFNDWTRAPIPAVGHRWRGPQADSYESTLAAEEYIDKAQRIRRLIAAGTVYQANLCRIMSARMPDTSAADVLGLTSLLAQGNPAPYLGCVRLPDHDVHIATASPELFLRVESGRIESGPIKGTATAAELLSPKDEAENVMIVDLVRNDLSRICATGSVEVPSLLRVEEHPGVVHLVSTVAGELRSDAAWPEIFRATFPPGSVTGAPKSSALSIISALEAAPRGPYCGAIGWVDADNGTAELAVGIRTFWLSEGGSRLNFGTGAGITWGSDPAAEWDETVLKAANLVSVAAGEWHG